MSDEVKHPAHYQGKGGVECIEVTEHLPCNLANAFKYVYRRDGKGQREKDLRKALWYLEREKQRRVGNSPDSAELTLRAYRVADAETEERFGELLTSIVESHTFTSEKSLEHAIGLLESILAEVSCGAV